MPKAFVEKPSARIGFKLTPKERKAIEKLDGPMSENIRQAIREFLSRRGVLVEEQDNKIRSWEKEMAVIVDAITAIKSQQNFNQDT